MRQTSKLLDGGRQGKRAGQLYDDLKQISSVALQTLLGEKSISQGFANCSSRKKAVSVSLSPNAGPQHRALIHSWTAFRWRTAKLLLRAGLALNATTAAAARLHGEALDRTTFLVERQAPLLEAAARTGWGAREVSFMLLLNAYIVLGALTAWLVVFFVRHVLYA